MSKNTAIGFEQLLQSVRQCRICADALPMGPRPVLQLDPAARILIAGQAPGRRVHECGIPFDDPSGDRLRQWLGISRETFYDASQVAILPMGFCYPGTGKSGDLPPRPECAPAWRDELMGSLSSIRLTLVIGQYAQKWHLPSKKKNLTETVRAWQEYPTGIMPLPHPSPRNNVWLKKNPWFNDELLPALQENTKKALRD
ncbi:MAG: uracil-DNA glycosylase family protein [Woeseiaceae bacterium]